MTTVTDGQDGTRDRIRRFLHQSGLASPAADVVPLAGDASTRRYFRIPDTGNGSLILALHAEALTFGDSSFANVHELLGRMPVPVPRTLGHSDELGIIALEDLGDATLQTHLQTADVHERLARYQEAVALIATIQRRGRELASVAYTPYSIAFDVEKLLWELDFFATHFLEAFRGASMTSSVRAGLAREFTRLAEALAGEPRVLCHRDYHSRNLMLHDGQLHVIDFQDARMGPDTYDLVSLLRDSYVTIADEEVETLLAFYLAERRRDGGSPDPGDAPAFRRRFDLMAVQRHLKALGTFGFQAASRSNPAYLDYLPRTLALTRSSLLANPTLSRLYALLAEQVVELR